MPCDLYFIDTNVLVYAHDSESDIKRRISRELIYQGVREGRAVISPQVLSEFFVTVTRKVATPISVEAARSEILLLATLASVDIDATLVLRAVEIMKRWQTSYWDALIIASAERAECGVIYSEDLAHGQAYGQVVIRNPYESELPGTA